MKTVEENRNVLLVTEITPESNNIEEALGLTPERCEELVNIAHRVKETKIDGKRTTMSYTFQEISKECKHANELIWIGFVIGSILERQSNLLTGLLKALDQR